MDITHNCSEGKDATRRRYFLDKSGINDTLTSMDITHHKWLDAKQHHKGCQSLDKLLKEEQRARISSQMIWKNQI